MANVKYLLARILKLDYKSMFEVARDVSKKSGKSFIGTCIDMTKCGIKYQAGYNDYREFEFYNLTAAQRETYLTRGKNNDIIRRYNDREYFDSFNDKIKFNAIFESFLGREWLDLDKADKKSFSDFMRRNPQIIAKPLDGEGGKGIDKYDLADYGSSDEIFDLARERGQRLVESFVKQHAEMNRLYPDSVNTMRMFTFCKNGKGHFLQAILKIGNGGVIDNFSSGGMYTFPDENGVVDVPAIDKADNLHSKHPVTGADIEGFKIPLYDEAVRFVEKAAEVVPQVAYVGWDVAISENGPVLIEGNCFPGVFQRRASFSKDKTGVIPKYREVMQI